MALLENRRVLLGISGGIAAYKAPQLVRELIAAGAQVRVVLTEAAHHFVAPLALQTVSQHAVGTDLFDPTFEHEIGHIELARWPDVILVAPATANLLGRVANGLCDDLLTTLLCATTAPIVFAPAMNTQMLLNPAVARNIERLRQDGHTLVDPDAGQLACQEIGPGRLPDPPELIQACVAALTPRRLAGRRVLITAGPTAEPIDPVRYVTNRSSGKMGFAIAQAAAAAGAEVTLVAGPVALPTPWRVRRVNVETAWQMRDAVFSLGVDHRADAIVKAAAVADYRPAQPADQKIKKTDGDMALNLTRNPDILGALCDLPAEQRPLLVGFAAETQNVEQLAAEKLRRKPVDLLVANLVAGPDSAFGADTSAVYFLTAAGGAWFGPAPKSITADEIVRRIADALADAPNLHRAE